MTATQADSERVQTRVSQEVNDEIEARAKARGLSKSEWIRVVILAAVEQDAAEAGQGSSTTIDDLGAYLEARFEQLEARIFHENSVTLHLVFETFREAVHASTTGMSGASEALPNDDAEAEERRRFLFSAAETEFARRREELIAHLKDMRDRAKTKSKALGRPLTSGANGSSEVH